jgi:hypothetical protein
MFEMLPLSVLSHKKLSKILVITMKLIIQDYKYYKYGTE